MWVDGRYTSSPLVAKMLESWAALRGRRRDGAAIVLATPYGDELADARARLGAFAGELLPALDAALAGLRMEVARR